MSVHLWSVNYIPKKIYLKYFEEMLISLSEETNPPDKYFFYISGKYFKEAEKLVNKILLNNFFILTNKYKTPQYIGMKEILLNTENIPEPLYIIFMDGDDLVSKNRTKKMFKSIQKYNLAIITIASKFYDDNKLVNDFLETTSEIIPLALENKFISKNDDKSYFINQLFVSGEDTSTMIVPYKILKKYLLKTKDLENNYSDVNFYKYLVDKKLVLFIPFKEPLYFYRIWDRDIENKNSIHH